ncbi:winged helix-turn-helix domain-containing protein [Micromonospora tarapacensis]|uniref:winged helix-turn-helix domain-containing protein n=1 Tax=Micromonospora tarapacensis TaxID=2835305 RepID=UPI001E43FC36|nr:helix-turn-helix domain-containing protein [Micromonospora tarapacensis]
MADEIPGRALNVTDPRALRAYAHPLRMRLIGLLHGEGPTTATQAAARLDDNVPNCSPQSCARSRGRSTRCWPGTTNGSPTRRNARPDPDR